MFRRWFGRIRSPPTLDKITDGDLKVTGNLAKAASGTVRICKDDIEIATAPVDANGTFSAPFVPPFKQGDSVTAQQISSAPGAFPKSYGLVSAPPTEVAANANAAADAVAGPDLTKGNTLFTRSTVGVQVASASGAPLRQIFSWAFS